MYYDFCDLLNHKMSKQTLKFGSKWSGSHIFLNFKPRADHKSLEENWSKFRITDPQFSLIRIGPTSENTLRFYFAHSKNCQHYPVQWNMHAELFFHSIENSINLIYPFLQKDINNILDITVKLKVWCSEWGLCQSKFSGSQIEKQPD